MMKSYVDLLINVNTIASDDFRKHNGVILQRKKAEKFIILRIKYTNIKICPRWISLLLMSQRTPNGVIW